MSQGVLPFQYEREKSEKGLTAMGGAGLYLDLFKALKLGYWLDREVGKSQGSQGYRDSEVIQALLLLNIVGGECVDDLERLESDEGLKRQYRKLVKKTRRVEKRFRRETGRIFPSQSAVFRYLERFCDGEEGKQGEAVIPGSVEEMNRFLSLNGRLMRRLQNWESEKVATLDQDATLVETDKESALYCYKGYKAYQPLNLYWWERELMVHTEFRPGNVPAGHEVLRVFREGLSALPSGVEAVYYRGDTASYQHDLLKYLDMESGPDQWKKRLGRMRFAVGKPMDGEYKKAVKREKEMEWRALDVDESGKLIPGGREWAEICYVPSELSRTKRGREFRYFATRQLLEERIFPEMEEQLKLPFPVMEMESKRYKVFGIVSNLDWEGSRIIRWHDERCGKSEAAHAILKNDFAGGKMPSGHFGANAVWWWIAVLAFNLQSIMKRVALGEGWWKKRMKAVRFHLIHLPGRVISRSNRLKVRLAIPPERLDWLLCARRMIMEFARGPCLTY